MAEEILSYLESHPHAADTATGVARFWLAGRHGEQEVEAAMAGLVDEQKMKRWRVSPDGGWIYARKRPGEAS